MAALSTTDTDLAAMPTYEKTLASMYPNRAESDLTSSERMGVWTKYYADYNTWQGNLNNGTGTIATKTVSGASSSSDSSAVSGTAGGSTISIGSHTFEVIDMVDLTEENLIPEHTTEAGFNVSDHIIVKPRKIKITLKLPKTASSGTLPGGSSSLDYAGVSLIKSIFEAGGVVSIVTPMITLSDMGFSALAIRDSTDSDNFAFGEAEFTEIKTATMVVKAGSTNLVGISLTSTGETTNTTATEVPDPTSSPKPFMSHITSTETGTPTSTLTQLTTGSKNTGTTCNMQLENLRIDCVKAIIVRDGVLLKGGNA